MTKNVIWFIDEDKDQVKTITKVLNRNINKIVKNQDELSVIGIVAYATMEEYTDILIDKRTVSIIVDQRLMTKGTTNYNGIDLAEYLRAIDPKIPIYILTAYHEDAPVFVGKEWNVEYIFSKDELSDKNSDERDKILQRILRHVNIYQDIVDSREKRFGELIRKSLSQELTELERNELSQIKTERTAGIAAKEIEKLSDLEKLISDLKELNDATQAEIDELSSSDTNK